MELEGGLSERKTGADEITSDDRRWYSAKTSRTADALPKTAEPEGDAALSELHWSMTRRLSTQSLTRSWLAASPLSEVWKV